MWRPGRPAAWVCGARVAASGGPPTTLRPVVGVIVPVHGFPGYLAETLDCLLAQRRRPRRRRRRRRVARADRAAPRPRGRAARWCGASGAAGRRRRARPGSRRWGRRVDLVALCDADDAWTEGKLAAQLAALDEHPRAALCFGRALVVGADGRPTGERWTSSRRACTRAPSLQALLYAANPIPTSSVVLRRGALERAGGFESPVRLAEDWDLWLRLAARGEPFVCAPEAVVRYRRHPGGLTADVAALARCQLELHRTHGELVAPAVRERALAADEAALRSATRGGLRALLPRRDPYRR